MKIGTKANAIDDLGKLDTSKMSIKVNGKQIYPQKLFRNIQRDSRVFGGWKMIEPIWGSSFKIIKEQNR